MLTPNIERVFGKDNLVASRSDDNSEVAFLVRYGNGDKVEHLLNQIGEHTVLDNAHTMFKHEGVIYSLLLVPDGIDYTVLGFDRA